MKKVKFFILAFIISNIANSQTLVEKYLTPGSGSNIIECEYHNFITTTNLSSGEFQVMKIDSSGTQIWNKTFGSTGGSFPNNVARTIIKAMPNKYIIMGTDDPGTSGFNKVLCLMIDSAGNTIFYRTFATNNSEGSCAAYDSISHFIYILGTVLFNDLDVYLAKLDTNGILIWETVLDFGADEGFSSIVMRNENEFWLVGGTNGYSPNHTFDGLIANFDSSGNINWTKNYGSSQNEDFEKIFLMDNGAIILGNTTSFGAGAMDAWILRTDENGDTLWTKTFGSLNSDVPFDMTFDKSKQNIWVVGESYLPATSLFQAWIFKIDTLGNFLNSKQLGGQYEKILNSVCYTDYNSLFAWGTYNSNTTYLVRLDSAESVTSIPLLDFQTSLYAFPIPSNDRVQITLPQNINGKIEIDVVNVFGQHFIPIYIIKQNELFLQLPDEEGLYLLTAKINRQKYYCKLIKT